MTDDTTPLPDWLTSHMKEVAFAVENQLDHDPKLPRTREQLALRNHNLECLLERALPLIAEGLSNKLIARRLDITEGTVKVHVKHLLKKLNLRSRVEAAVWVVGRGHKSG